LRRTLILCAAGLAVAPNLALAQPAALEEVIVTAARRPTLVEQTPFSVSVVTREQLDRIAPTRLEDAFRSVPGLQMGTQGNAYFRIATRGFRDTADVLVLVDGIPFRQVNGAADLTMLPVGFIDRIEFLKGPGSSIYGRGAVGGVIQLFTRPATETAIGEVQVLTGSYGYAEGRLRAAIPTGSGALYLQAGGSHSDGFQDNTDRDAHYVSAAAVQRFGDVLTVEVNGGYSAVKALRGSIVPLIDGRPAYGIDEKVNYGVPGAQFDGRYRSVGVPITLQLGGLRVKNIAHWSRYERFATGGITIVPAPAAVTRGYSEADNTQDIFYNELVADWSGQGLGGDLSLVAGWSYEKGKLLQFSQSFGSQPTFRAPNFNTPVSNPNNPMRGIPGAVTRTDSEQTVHGLFVDTEYRIGRLGLRGGLRRDSFDQELVASNVAVRAAQSRAKTTARLGADYALVDSPDAVWAVFANYAEGFKPQFPAFSTLNNIVVPNLLRPEFVKSYEGGVKARLAGDRLVGQASVFEIERVDAQRSFRTGPDTFIFQNARQKVRGFEAEARFRVSADLDGYATYAYQDAKNTEFITTAADFSGNQIRMQPKHFASFGANYRAGPLNFNGSVNYVGERPLRDNLAPAQIQILPSYTVANASVRWTHGRAYIQGAVNNIFDKLYIADDFSSQEAGNFGPPRSFVVTLGVRY